MTVMDPQAGPESLHDPVTEAECVSGLPSLSVKDGQHLRESGLSCPPDEGPADDGSPTAIPGGGWRARPLICNQRGLHARAAAKFVKLVAQFDAEILVSKGGQSVCGQSIMGLMMLAAAPGCRITVQAHGSEAEAAVRAVVTLVAERFHEE